MQKQPEAIEKSSNELIYFPSGQFISQIALEYRSIIADVLWLQAIQYYGQHALTDRQFTHLFRIFKVITLLDPDFKQCYVFGGTIVTYDQHDPQLGFRLLDMGLINMPESWEIPFIKGFLYYVYMKDYDAARIWFSFASTKPDAPYYCEQFAAASMMRKGDYITSLSMWSQIYNGSDNKYSTDRAEENIIEIMSKHLNKYKTEHTLKETEDYINSTISKLDFLPFPINVKIGDTVTVERI